MKSIQILGATFAALALFGCGQPATTADVATPTAEAPAVDPNAPPAQSGEAVTAEFLAGAWGDNGDCTSTITFNADNTFRMQDGATGTWTLEGDRVLLSGTNGEFGLTIAKGNENQLLIGQPDGGFGISQRC